MLSYAQRYYNIIILLSYIILMNRVIGTMWYHYIIYSRYVWSLGYYYYYYCRTEFRRTNHIMLYNIIKHNYLHTILTRRDNGREYVYIVNATFNLSFRPCDTMSGAAPGWWPVVDRARNVSSVRVPTAVAPIRSSRTHTLVCLCVRKVHLRRRWRRRRWHYRILRNPRRT